MSQRNRQIPEGMQDTLPGARAAQREMEAQLRAHFAAHGYREVGTPLLEYLDTLNGGTAAQRMWKTFDRDGRVLAVRPDNTTPVVRLAATRLKDAPLPLRLCYVQDVLEFPRGEHPRFCQSPQAGVEMLGEGSADADAEVIALAIAALQAGGLQSFQIDIGQVDFFKGMMEESGLTAAQQEALRGHVEQKNMLAIELLLREVQAGEQASRRLMQLPALYGGAEVLAAARALTRSPRALAALARIEAVLAALADYGLAHYVSIDLGMVHAIDYYTGVIFRGMTAHLGKPLLSGGRYDGLPAEFERPVPAIGFAMDVGQLLIALERQHGLPPEPRCGIFLGYAPGSSAAGIALAQALRQQGEAVAIGYAADIAALVALAQRQGARKAIFIDEQGTRQEREVAPCNA